MYFPLILKLSLEISHCLLLQGPYVGTEMSFSVSLVELKDDIIGEVRSSKIYLSK